MVKKPTRKPRKRRSIKPVGRSPVIAVRVPLPLHERITSEAEQADRSMSEQMSYLLSRAFEWQDTYLERAQMIEEARQIIRNTQDKCAQLQHDTLRTTLRQLNWRELDGGWYPPEAHGYPPSGFVPVEPVEEEKAS